ncbi:hypothetical protein ARMGADRAFT_1098726 [Armillaria gallica]|uniref:DNA breaking-rejoining enzyme n=1 Tax=Armillaria gallica TaxID=47427 RepID=A0A2H3CVG2_ARMGA|nr:hypothetical protein ARMGADRAFT_1098726 [Armillaria gallica]
MRNIPEDARCPASLDILSSFLASMAGNYASGTLSSYLHGLRAWHILHGLPWLVNEAETQALITAAIHLQPPHSKKKPWLPYTSDTLTTLLLHFDFSLPLDAATRNRNKLEQTVFFIPKAKTSVHGEDVFWATQDGPSDPQHLLENHFTINDPPVNQPVFSYIHKGKHRPLTKPAFLSRLHKVFKDPKMEPLQGHGIRIGYTLEYLLRGIPFDVIKTIGCWKSDVFILYLRKHAQILAPYMQAVPAIHEQFIRYTMPQVR